MGAVPQLNCRPSHACGQCKARHICLDRQIPCAECCLLGLKCMANPKSTPGACEKRSTTKPRTAPHSIGTWLNFIVDLEHGRDNIFDSIYGSKVQGTDPKNVQQNLCLVQAKEHEIDRTQTPFTPRASSSSATNMDPHVASDTVSISSTGGITIPVSDDDDALYEDFQDQSLYRLAERLARLQRLRLAA